MKLTILGFGIAKEIFSSAAIVLETKETPSVKELKLLLEEKYPRLRQLSTFMVAVNNQYASAGDLLSPEDEIAIIPPVSGG